MKAALIVLDGWGMGDHDHLDAVAAAETPVFDRIRDRGAATTLETHGRTVGLPAGQMGNSEVGHLTIGAGRVVVQESAQITEAVRDGTFGEIPALEAAFEYATANDGRVHLAGLVSDGGVHSRQSHLHALIEEAADRDVTAVTHAFTDGRDTAPTSGAGFLADLGSVTRAAGTGSVATVTGRYYAMDRDGHWDRTRRAYDAIVHAAAPYDAPSAVEAVEAAYDRGDTDEYVEPTLVDGGVPVRADDAVIVFNFRADRARQLTRMLADIEPEWPGETRPPPAHLVTMTAYDRRFDLPVAFPPNEPTDTVGEVLASAGLTQLRIAESEKYAHVTYFLNGGREVEFPDETRHIVDSPDVSTYDRQPEMSARTLTDDAIAFAERADPDVVILNYANPDMVGHTGDYEAAVAAVAAVDEQLGRLLAAFGEAGAHVLVTADHGNADDMGTPEAPHTAHTTNPVPFVYLDPAGTDGGRRARSGGTLADVAPTILTLVGVPVPEVMTGSTLLTDA